MERSASLMVSFMSSMRRSDSSIGRRSASRSSLIISQQLFAQALEAPVASGANEISARVFNEALQARQQFFPIPQRTAVFHPLGGTHLKNLAHRAMQPLFQNLARELGRRRTLRIAGAVGFVDHQD